MAASRYAQAAIRLRRAGRLAPARSLLERAIRLSPASPKLYVQLVLLCADERRMAEAGDALEQCAAAVRARPDRRAEYDAYVERELAPLPSMLAAYHSAVGVVEVQEVEPRGPGPSVPGAAPSPEVENPVVREPDALVDSFAADFLREDQTLSSLIRKLEIELDLEPIAFAKVTLPAEFLERLQDGLRSAREAIDLGIAFVVMEQPEVAATFFDRVAEDDAAYGEAQCLAAGAFAAAGDWLKVLDRAQSALRGSQHHARFGQASRSADVLAEGTYQLAWAYARLGDWAQARARLELLEKTFPNYRDIVSLRALVGAAPADAATPTGMPPVEPGGAK